MNGAKRAVIGGAVAALVIGLVTSPLPSTGEAQVPSTGEAQVPSTGEAQVNLPPTGDAQVRYQEAYDWCGGRFPYRTDLQEACRWGAFEMLPRQQEEVRDA